MTCTIRKIVIPGTTNGRRILLLLLFSTLASSVSGQYTQLHTQFPMTYGFYGAENLFNDTINNRLILVQEDPFKTLYNKAVPAGTHIVFMDTDSGKATVAPASLRYAKHVTMFGNKLYYIKDTVKVYHFDLNTLKDTLLLTSKDRIINIYPMTKNRVLVNARTGGTVQCGDSTCFSTRIAVFHHGADSVQNITDEPYIFQAFVTGDWVVYQQSSYWFGKSGLYKDKITIQNIHTGRIFYRTDVARLFCAIPVSDSTFWMWYDPSGYNRIAKVNVEDPRNIGDLFYKDDILNMGAGGDAPPVAGNNPDPSSPFEYMSNGEWQVGNLPYRNLKTSEVFYPEEDDVYFWNLHTLEKRYAGKFWDSVNNRVSTGVYWVSDRYVAFSPWGFLTTKLYGPAQTTSVSTAKIAGLSLYPNPATNGSVNITMPGDGTIEVYSITGQSTFSQKVLAGGMQVPILTGVNYIRVIIGNRTQTFMVLGN